MKEKVKEQDKGYVIVKGAREHNLKNISLSIPRNALVVFTGVSGSGKSSLAFGTIYAEAQRRYLESVSPYARRLFHQLQVPKVDSIEGLPPAIALQQQRGAPTTRSSVGSVTTLSNLLRMLYSRAGDYPKGQMILYAESFSANTPEGACPHCHGLGKVYDITERSMVPDDSLTIRERAIAAWPSAWQGQNLREILMTLGYDVDIPWKDLPEKDRDWILFTEEQPVVPVYSGFTAKEMRQAMKQQMQPSYMGTFTGARRYVRQTFANSPSALMKKRVSQYMISTDCPVCKGKRLNAAALSVHFAGMDIVELSRMNIRQLSGLLTPYTASGKKGTGTEEKQIVADRIITDLLARVEVLLSLGLGYLTLERSTPTLSPGELQRLRLATQVYSNLFGVIYVLDEPSAGLHPSDTEALMDALEALKLAGNSIFVVEHEIEVIKRADWIVDVGPDAGQFGGEIMYSGPVKGLTEVAQSRTAAFLRPNLQQPNSIQRQPTGWLKLDGLSKNNIEELAISFPLGVLTSVTGVSGSGKSTLVSQILPSLIRQYLGGAHAVTVQEDIETDLQVSDPGSGRILSGAEGIRRCVQVDQQPIGRTPRSNLATYTGLFDDVRKIFASTKAARDKRMDAGFFSFNVAKGRCPQCQGEGFVMVELLFLPSVYSPCPTCKGTRYNEKALSVRYKERNIAEVLDLTVSAALPFFAEDSSVKRVLDVLIEVGLGYIKLGQAATELSGGEAQRIKLATELQRPGRGNTLYILDEPTTGLHPLDVEKLIIQLNRLVGNGNTVIVVEHDMQVVSRSDWVIDIGPGAGEDGGRIVAEGTPGAVAKNKKSRTAPYLRKLLSL